MRQQPKKILTKHNSLHILEGTETLLPLHAQHVELQGKRRSHQQFKDTPNAILTVDGWVHKLCIYVADKYVWQNVPKETKETDLFKNRRFQVSVPENNFVHTLS